MEVFKTNKGLQYLYEQGSGYISLAPKAFANHVKGLVDDQYYASKLKYLSSYGMISLDNSLRSTYRFLTEDDIKLAILNTHQIISTVQVERFLYQLKVSYIHVRELVTNLILAV